MKNNKNTTQKQKVIHKKSSKKSVCKICSVKYPVQKATPGAAGFDLHSIENIQIEPGQRCLVNTGVRIHCPKGTYAMLCPRSGLSLRGCILACTPGTIDSDYRGEIKALFWNISGETFSICDGDRIAQMIILQTFPCYLKTVSSLTPTKRGEGGFGSTGK